MASYAGGGDEPLTEALLGRAGSGDEDDLEEIHSVSAFLRCAAEENRRLWSLAGPAIFTSLAQYSLGAVTQVAAGHLTTLELDAVSTENSVVAGLAFGIMYGMGSALETLCGQAYGAKKLPMLGVYLQRSWLLLTAMAVCMLPLYLFATPILRLFHQDVQIAVMAGKFSLYMIPQLFAYALNFPIQKFLQAQSKLMAMAAVSAAALLFHVALTWFLVVPMQMGLVGLAVALNASWWFVVLGQLAYIGMGYCPGAWNGFELDSIAFTELLSFARLSIGSAIMICLEFWFYMFLIVIVGNLPNAQVAVAAVSICTNLFGWQIMVFFGFNAAISVRVSNELGAGRPRAARFAIAVVLMSSVAIGVAFFVAVLLLRDVYGAPFTESPEVVHAVASLGVVFAFTLLLNSVQPVLSGVAVGAGWQWLVAYINLGCYYGVGIPVGYMIAFRMRRGIQGMWGGMLTGVGLQTVILIAITMRTNWNKEASEASSRIRQWGGGGGGASPKIPADGI
ncbi:Protein TRANSPARENT TESTA 12 [Hordeum vulgare]|uniref:Protein DETOXIFICATION n=1 Tax=Hordeum vulgare subsp. vulgare TaxID=112509 RepID=A0A8I6YNM6_HORVV|nr:protein DETOXIFICATION 33-like [Hordeum vulgare subsp. vulgare]KAE8794610.1 Protein TRANSPARENT TESTA 12 [Hordeum vulgare]